MKEIALAVLIGVGLLHSVAMAQNMENGFVDQLSSYAGSHPYDETRAHFSKIESSIRMQLVHQVESVEAHLVRLDSYLNMGSIGPAKAERALLVDALAIYESLRALAHLYSNINPDTIAAYDIIAREITDGSSSRRTWEMDFRTKIRGAIETSKISEETFKQLQDANLISRAHPSYDHEYKLSSSPSALRSRRCDNALVVLAE